MGTDKEQPVRRSGNRRCTTIFLYEYLCHPEGGMTAIPDLNQNPHDIPDHVVQKSVGPDFGNDHISVSPD